MFDWKNYVLDARFGREDPVPWSVIANKLVQMNVWPELTWEQVKQKARDFCRQRPEYTGKRLNAPKPKVEKPKPVKVTQNYEPSETGDEGWKPGQTVRFAVVSDTHINSKYTQLTYLHDFYEECRKRGIKHVYNCGDISDGENMRVGHNYELYKIAADEQVDEICRVYPRVEGITTHFITGNHDASAMKHCGYDIGPAIALRRPDMKYLGKDIAIVHLTPNCTMELLHPWDGGSYALSYRPQKIVEALDGGTKPNLLFIGHYHKALFMEYRNVATFLAGCFQGTTPFMRGKGLSRHMGGWIVEIDTDLNGYITRITPTFIPYYVDIDEDYKHFAE